MSRIILISSFAALFAVSGAHNANAIETANQGAWYREAQACADVGIDPGSAAFSQCVADLHHSLWAAQNLEDN
jgi:hypothetical protein